MSLDETKVDGVDSRRLEFVDGLRGIAAFVVVVGHAIGMVGPDHPVVPLWRADTEHLVIWPWLFGKQMVWMFIMLSGFALYWSEESRLDRGAPRTPPALYAWRRAFRILPTYYVAFSFGVIVVVALGDWLLSPSPSLDTYAPVTPGGVASHIFLVQNLWPEFVFQANPPLWSIAVEAQLYVLFPLLLLLATRLSVYGGAAVLFGLVAAVNVATDLPVFSLAQWFFAGAVVAHFSRRREVSAKVVLPIALLATAIGLLRVPALNDRVGEVVWLVAGCALLAGLVRRAPGGWNVPTWRPVRWMGERSYSLYAIHFPLLLLAWSVIGRCEWSKPWLIATTVVAGTALSVLAAMVMFVAVERPSLRTSRHLPLWATRNRDPARGRLY